MKRFDLRQIMRDAHRTYKYVGRNKARPSVKFGNQMETGKTECYNAGRAGKTTGRKK